MPGSVRWSVPSVVLAAALTAATASLAGCRLAPDAGPTERERAGAEIQITSADAPQQAPDISGSRVVWEDWRHGHADVYLYDLATGEERRLTDDPADQRRPAVAGDWVAWEDDRHGTRDVYVFDLEAGVERRLTPEGSNQTEPALSDGVVVWRDDRDGRWELYRGSLPGGDVDRLTDAGAVEQVPALSEGLLVWLAGGVIRARELASGDETAVPGDYRVEARSGLAVDGDRVVWTDLTYDPDILFHDFGRDTTLRITAGLENNRAADVSGDRVVWIDDRAGAPRVFLFDMAAGNEVQITGFDGSARGRPRIDGRRIVWTDRRSGVENVHLFELRAP